MWIFVLRVYTSFLVYDINILEKFMNAKRDTRIIPYILWHFNLDKEI